MPKHPNHPHPEAQKMLMELTSRNMSALNLPLDRHYAAATASFLDQGLQPYLHTTHQHSTPSDGVIDLRTKASAGLISPQIPLQNPYRHTPSRNLNMPPIQRERPAPSQRNIPAPSQRNTPMSSQRNTPTPPLLKQITGLSAASHPDLLTTLVNSKRVQCFACFKTYSDKAALKIHFSAIHLRKMYKCTVKGCTVELSSRRSINRHSANPNPKLHSPFSRRYVRPDDRRLTRNESGFGMGMGRGNMGEPKEGVIDSRNDDMLDNDEEEWKVTAKKMYDDGALEEKKKRIHSIAYALAARRGNRYNIQASLDNPSNVKQVHSHNSILPHRQNALFNGSKLPGSPVNNGKGDGTVVITERKGVGSVKRKANAPMKCFYGSADRKYESGGNAGQNHSDNNEDDSDHGCPDDDDDAMTLDHMQTQALVL